jgi:alpha-beta hydrolase superfamily lysophospholipase
MPALSFSPALSALAAFTRFTPPPMHTLLRATSYKLRPPRPRLHALPFARAEADVMARGLAVPRQRSALLREHRFGAQPTIVLGGFVPDSTEQVFLLRSFLLKHGSVYYFNYPAGGFSLDLLCAQLDDLVTDLNTRHGQRPVIVSVSFGSGIALEWLRRSRAAGRAADIAGLVLISPVACAADVVTPGELKPSTLLGRALKPFLDAGPRVENSVIEKSRVIFAKMFEAGAQNREALRALMTVEELHRLRDAVLGTIKNVDAVGACERVQSLRDMPALSAWAKPADLPLTDAPTLVLYAEKETAVLAENSPTRTALESALPAFFPRGEIRVVTGGAGSAVQHASLIFHYYQFLPHLAGFFRGLKSGKLRLAA